MTPNPKLKTPNSLSDAWRRAWEIPDRRPIYHWAADGNITFPAGVYTKSGPFRVDSSRHLIGPFDALDDDLKRFVTVVAPPRTGKSVIADVWIPSVIVRDPGEIQWLLQTRNVVKDYAEGRIHPVLRACPGVEAVWPHEDRHKGSTFRVSLKNGCHLYISGPSIANLQTKGIRYQVRDEVWIWKPGRLANADARLKDWRKIGASKALTVSQGSWKDDDFCRLFESGDQQEWFVPCLHCGKYQWPKFRGERPDGSKWGIRYDVPDRQKNDHRALPELLGQILPTVRFECLHCRKTMEDSEVTRSEWNRLGRYEIQNPKAEAEHASFRWSGAIARSWKDMVSEFIKAMDAFQLGEIEALQEFIQKEIPDFFSDAALFNADPLRKESYDIRSPWKDEDARFFTIDRQTEGLMYGVIRAWSKAKGGRRLWRGRLYSEDEIKAKATEFDVPPFRVLLDAGFEARIVYAMCVRNGWIALKGEGNVNFFLHPIKKDGKTIGYVRKSISQPSYGDPEGGDQAPRKRREGARYAPLLRFADSALNYRLQRLIDGRGIPFVNPADVDDPEEEEEYRKQLRAEYAITKRNPITGAAKRIFVCPSGNNHFRDCEKMQLVGVTGVNILADEIPEEASKTNEGAEKED